MSAAVAPGSKPGPIAVRCAGGALPCGDRSDAGGEPQGGDRRIDGIADPDLAPWAHWLSLGQLGKLIAIRPA